MDKRTVILNPSRMGLSEYLRQDWVVNAEEGTTVQDILDPGYWAHTSAQMKPYDRIEVRLETGEWIADLIALQVDRNWARVHMLHLHDLVAVASEVPAPQKFRVEWKGPQRKHVVIRLSDSLAIQEGFSAKTEAIAWLQTYEQATA